MKISKVNADQVFNELKASFLEFGPPITDEKKNDNRMYFYSNIFFEGRCMIIGVIIFPDHADDVLISFMNELIPPGKLEVVGELINLINMKLYNSKYKFYPKTGEYVLMTRMILANNRVDGKLFHKILYDLLVESDFYGKLIDEQIKSDRMPTDLWNNFLKTGQDRKLEKAKNKKSKIKVLLSQIMKKFSI